MEWDERILQELKRIDEAQRRNVEEVGRSDVMDRAFDQLRRRAIQRAMPVHDPLSDRVIALSACAACRRA